MFWRIHKLVHELLSGHDGPAGRNGLPCWTCWSFEKDGRNGNNRQKGDKGERGEAGIVGSSGLVSGGATYTRWGRTSCPNITGTSLVYSGRAGKSHYTHDQSGLRRRQLPNNPVYGRYAPGVQNQAPIYM